MKTKRTDKKCLQCKTVMPSYQQRCDAKHCSPKCRLKSWRKKKRVIDDYPKEIQEINARACVDLFTRMYGPDMETLESATSGMTDLRIKRIAAFLEMKAFLLNDLLDRKNQIK